MKRRRVRPASAPQAPASAADIDARYGLEPVFDPATPSERSELGEFVCIDCPYCGERYETPIDLTAGSASCIEDCQICCRPIELEIAVGADGALESVAIRRLD